MAFLVNWNIWLTILSCCGSIPVPSGDREGWCFKHFVSELRVCLSAASAKNVSWLWLSLLQEWGGPAIAFFGKYINICIFCVFIHIYIYIYIYIYIIYHMSYIIYHMSCIYITHIYIYIFFIYIYNLYIFNLY